MTIVTSGKQVQRHLWSEASYFSGIVWFHEFLWPQPQVSTMASSPPVAYLINQYPLVSLTFIRREIHALERQGVAIERIALRGWDNDDLVDARDIEEQGKTRYVQQGGIAALLVSMLVMAIRQPVPFFYALRTALSMSRKAVRPLPYHLIYLAQACRILPWLEAKNVRHLHAHFGTNPAEVACLIRCLGGPEYSFTIHGQDEIEGASRLHFPQKVGRAKFAVAVSAFCRAQILREISHDLWHKLKIVHCGIEEPFFSDAHTSPANPVFISIARLSPEKGHLVLLDAFAPVAAAHPEARLILVGDGPMRGELEARITARGLEAQISITGWVDATRIQREIDNATILVQPSFIEGLPLVIMEALARRLPVVSTYVGGIPELVAPDCGWLVPAGDVPALSRAMTAVIAVSTEDLARMGAAGQARVREDHLIDREAEKLAKLFAGGDA